MPKEAVIEKATFFDREVKDFHGLSNELNTVGGEKNTVWRIIYGVNPFGETPSVKTPGTVYAVFEVKKRNLNPFNQGLESGKIMVQFKEKDGGWKVANVAIRPGKEKNIVGMREPEEVYERELNQLLKTKLGSEWLEKQREAEKVRGTFIKAK